MSMAWRTRTTTEATTAESPVAQRCGSGHGLDTTPNVGGTNYFVLQMSYNDTLMNSETLTADLGGLHLVWRNNSGDWVNAVTGNHYTAAPR